MEKTIIDNSIYKTKILYLAQSSIKIDILPKNLNKQLK